uniref:hypothetical protein n=1 Tax=Agrococcus jejuensis TaxID=399736 RepID=UPI001C92D554
RSEPCSERPGGHGGDVGDVEGEEMVEEGGVVQKGGMEGERGKGGRGSGSGVRGGDGVVEVGDGG